MTKDEALKLALSALDEVRQETFRLMRDGQTLYAEKKVWMAIYTIKEVLAQPQRTWVGLSDEEIKAFDTWHDNREEEVGWCNPSEIVAYIEAKLKQKNGYAEEKNT